MFIYRITKKVIPEKYKNLVNNPVKQYIFSSGNALKYTKSNLRIFITRFSLIHFRTQTIQYQTIILYFTLDIAIFCYVTFAIHTVLSSSCFFPYLPNVDNNG